MIDYKFDNNPVTNGVLTTSYTYGDTDKEYVFSCKGRPFAALVSSNLPIPTSTLLDYDLIRKLRIKMTDVQCRKFQFGGHKMRILGRVSSAVQCVQGGRITGSFHVKGLVVTDLYELLDTHCVAGTKMREKIAQYDKDWAANLASDTTDAEDDDMVTPEMTSSSSSPEGKMTSSSSSPGDKMTTSSSLVGMMTSSPVTMRATTPSVTTMTSSSSAKMTPHVFLRRTDVAGCRRVDDKAKWTTSSSKLQLPNTDVTNTFSISAITYDQGGHSGVDGWIDSCYRFVDQNGRWQNREGDIIDLSMIDGRPRVVNLDGPEMLRVGDWGSLEDPYKHQVRHMHLAKIRRAEPDRACHWCSYSLGHKCDLYRPSPPHCVDCCLLMQKKNRQYERGDARVRERRDEESRRRERKKAA